jgi:peptide/nickel transport system substrate-binding protein/oligopeptide transport system substrate-binding protein
MRRTRCTLFLLLCSLAIVALGAPAASARQAARGTPAAGGTLVYQLSSQPPGIDPLFAVPGIGGPSWIVADALFDGLTSWDAQDSAVMPAVASSWSANATATVWTFNLRADATFTNGKAVTAQDFKFAWERLFKGASSKGWASYMLSNVKGANAFAAGKAKHISGVVAQNATTLVVKLTTPLADFPSLVANPNLAPVPHGLLTTAKKIGQFRNAPVGDGPFMLAKPWNRHSTISLVANPDYYGTMPNIAGITFKVIAKRATAYAQFQAGKLDVANFPAASLAAAEAAYGTSADGFTAQPTQQVIVGPSATLAYWVFNTTKAPLDDVLVRRAFSLALDRTNLSTELTVATSTTDVPATDMLSPGVPGYVPGQWAFATLDLTQAAALLTQAGFPGGAGLPQISCLYTADKLDLVTEFKTELAAIGVNVKLIKVGDWTKLYQRIDSGNFMTSPAGWEDDTPAPDNVIFGLFYGPWNYSGSFYDDPSVNAALLAARGTLDYATRLTAYQSIDATVAADVPVTPIAYYGRDVVCSARLHDAVLSPMDLFDFTRVWIQ